MKQILDAILNEKPKKLILDTDTYNEVDDQFAVAYAMLSPELQMLSFNAAPFLNNRSSSAEDGMEKSFNELIRITSLTKPDHNIPIYRGSRFFMTDRSIPVDSPAAHNIIDTVKGLPAGERLYIAVIGAATNVASALVMCPEIKERITVVWLAGNSYMSGQPREFNMHGDLCAAQIMFDCGVPLLQIPCDGVCTELATTIPELDCYLKGKNELCDYLCGIVRGYTDDTFCWSKVIWDVSAVACLILPDSMNRVILPTPMIPDRFYSFDAGRHPYIYVRKLYRDEIFRDLFRKLANK
jgi:inosine-uridine nucleoside N-ribohydrolase